MVEKNNINHSAVFHSEGGINPSITPLEDIGEISDTRPPSITEIEEANDELWTRLSVKMSVQEKPATMMDSENTSPRRASEASIGLNEGDADTSGMKRPLVFKSTLHEIVCLFILTFAPVLSSLNGGALMIALPKIGEKFHVAGGTLSWSMSASSLATGAFLLLMGRLADTLGRRRLVLLSYGFFSFMSLGAGFANQYVGFIILRALQGLAGAAAVTSAVGILGSEYPPGKRRNFVMATFSAGAPIGFVMGIVSGGICTEILSWQSVLYFFAIVYAILTVLGWFVLPKTDPQLNRQFLISSLKTIDYGGALLTISGFTLFVFALSQWDSSSNGWKTPYIIACLIIGAVIIISFCFYEAYIPAHPLMPIHIWKAPGFALCMATVVCGWMNFTGVISFYATLYFQQVRGASPILTTAFFVPMAVGGILVNIFAGLFLHKIPGRVLLLIAMSGFTASALLWSFVGMNTLYWAIPFPGLVLVVVGADLAYNVCNMHALSTVDKSLQSTAAGVFNTCLQLGTALGLAVSTSVVAAVVPDQLVATPVELLRGYRAGYWFAIGIGAVGLFLSCFLKIGTQGGNRKKNI